jgi:hypothetical protein
MSRDRRAEAEAAGFSEDTADTGRNGHLESERPAERTRTRLSNGRRVVIRLAMGGQTAEVVQDQGDIRRDGDRAGVSCDFRY